MATGRVPIPIGRAPELARGLCIDERQFVLAVLAQRYPEENWTHMMASDAKPEHKDGFYWLTSERTSSPSLVQHIEGKWYCVNEEGPVTMDELNQRGWDLGKRIKWPKP